MHYERIFASLLLSKTPLMVSTIFLSLIASLALKVWGGYHPDPLQASFPILTFMLFGPVALAGGLVFLIVYKKT